MHGVLKDVAIAVAFCCLDQKRFQFQATSFVSRVKEILALFKDSFYEDSLLFPSNNRKILPSSTSNYQNICAFPKHEVETL